MPELAKDLKTTINQRLNEVGPSGIREFDVEISKIPDIVKLTIGEPDFNTPEDVKQAAINSIKNNDSHYSAQAGTLKLRKAISGYLKKSQNLTYDPESEVIVTVGATEAIFASLTSLLNPGDKVLIPTPVFSLYFPIITLAGATPVMLDTSKDGFVLSPEKLEQAIEANGDAVKAVLLNYPNNPSGVEYSESEIRSLAKVIDQHSLYVIADEIYAELTYGVKHFSIAKLLPERTILINGVSKSHAMTGYRIGYIAAPHEIVKSIIKMHAFMITSPSNPAQAGAAEALTNGLGDTEPMRKIYQERRDYIYEQMKDMGLKAPDPQGAFYLFAQIPAKFGSDDVAFATDLAKKAKVGVTPGSCFGKGGEGYVRLSYAASNENIKLAMKRIKKYLSDQQ